MNQLRHEEIQQETEKKSAKRLNKKKPSMKVSGRSIKELQQIIINKSKFDKGG